MKFMKETDFFLKQSPNSYQKQESTDNINCRKKHYLCHNSFIFLLVNIYLINAPFKDCGIIVFLLYHSTPSGRQSFGSGVSRFFLTFFFGCNSGRSGTSLGRKLIVFTSIIYHNSYSKKPASFNQRGGAAFAVPSSPAVYPAAWSICGRTPLFFRFLILGANLQIKFYT